MMISPTTRLPCIRGTHNTDSNPSLAKRAFRIGDVDDTCAEEARTGRPGGIDREGLPKGRILAFRGVRDGDGINAIVTNQRKRDPAARE